MQAAEGYLTEDSISDEEFLSKDEYGLSRHSGRGGGVQTEWSNGWTVFSEEVEEVNMYRKVRKTDLHRGS